MRRPFDREHAADRDAEVLRLLASRWQTIQELVEAKGTGSRAATDGKFISVKRRVDDMGQALDRDGNVLGEAFGATKQEVFDKLTSDFKDAHEIRIRSLSDAVREVEAREHYERNGGDHTITAMPLYKCHKEVWALKIAAVVDPTRDGNESDGSLILSFAEPGYAPIRVPHDYVRKHDPTSGGYYVVYKDGYKSFSPAQAFEEGYSRA